MNWRQSILTLGVMLSVGGAHAGPAGQAGSSKHNQLHKKSLHLANGASLVFKAENHQGMSVAENDILLGPAPQSDDGITSRGSGAAIISSRWPNGIIPFQFAADISNEDVLARIREAVAHWNEHSSIRLVERTKANQAIYEDYLEFTSSTGCASYVGRLGGRQEVWVSESCASGSIVHELGHAIGLLHEHTRNDRDQHIVINYDNIIPGKEHNYAIPSSNADDLGPYDYGSIMHYGASFFSKNGGDTISPIADITGIRMGQRIALSEGDLQAVDLLYATDLSLTVDTPETVEAGRPFNLSVNVTNLGELGASEVLVVLPISADNQLTSFQGDGWSCEQQAAQIACGLAILSSADQRGLDLTINSSFEPPASLDLNLSSRTADSDLANNGKPLPADQQDTLDEFFTEPMLAEANTSSTT
ncbi:MAG: M12 family metallopeptidase, partial [Gammaproteobacteria bacterium]|nr:M12 family metallopeptidase [Gammaproteobacteria bacterium]